MGNSSAEIPTFFFFWQTSLFIIKTCRSVPDMYYILYCKLNKMSRFYCSLVLSRRKSPAITVPRNNTGFSELPL